MPDRSSASGSGLFSATVARGAAAAAVSDQASLAAMLRAEAALARAEAEVGLLSDDVATAIERACAVGRFDPDAIGIAAGETGTPVVALVAAIRDGLPATAADVLHLGATSQDIVDTAAMLVTADALDAILEDLDASANAAANLAMRHRTTPMVARTLLQHGTPTTFGARAAGWLAGLDAATDGLHRIRRRRLAVQLGGSSGTLAAAGAAGPSLIAAFARELGLAVPAAPWHTERSRIAELAGGLGVAAAAVAKPALDLVLLSQTEVAEVADDRPGLGGSSAMPHKHNPIAAINARSCAAQVPGLAATLLAAAGASEHERGAGAWQAEREALTAALRSTGSAAAWLAEALAHVEVDAARMRDNLQLDGGATCSDVLVRALAPSMGRTAALAEVQAALADAARNSRPFSEVVAGRAAVRERLDEAAVAALLRPDANLGSAAAFVDRILVDHETDRRRRLSAWGGVGKATAPAADLSAPSERDAATPS